MGPKTFVECYVCFKEFGSRSIPFHEPKCLEKWRLSNRNLPAEKRSSTPVKPANWKYSQISFWICSHCQVSVPFAKRNQHISSCLVGKLGSNNKLKQNSRMTGVVKTDFSPKRGKENKNISNNIPMLSVLKKNVKNAAKNSPNVDGEDKAKENTSQTKNSSETVIVDDCDTSTSKRALRPQTKVLRRPTPNLNHPVIHVDSDDSSGDSSCSDKSKEDNPKRLKMGETDAAHKTKNFIMYNKYNVERNTKNTPKERTSATNTSTSLIPNPCNSCNRSSQPERLHSHAKKDSRGLMNRRSPSMDIKMTSPQKKASDNTDKLDIKMMSPKKKIPENIDKSDIKITTPRRKIPESVDRLDIKMVSPQKKLPENMDKLDVKMASPQKKSSQNVDKTKAKPKDSKIPTSTNCDAVKDTNKDCSSQRKESLKKVSSESCLVAAVSESDQRDPNLVEPLKSCYICQKEVKISLLLLHESQCLESWKKANNSLTPNLRKLPPQRPEDNDIPNEDDPAWTTVQSQLIPCPVCDRTFFPERLPVHRRVCKGKPSPRPLKRASSMREHSATSRQGDEQRPAAVYVSCYVCGKNFGSWVISMHEQQCLRKWKRENDKLPDEEQQDEPEKNPESPSDDEVTSLIELGDNAWESHLQQLVPCPLCSRTFFPK